ncbi:kinesin-domain-containing protein [Myriangium duriaei CBS 260.36]|uniref:Kinesin-like protein KIP2 n=1 Tax=Myriangium duriaei CBS 260.36 TaxID=1168546 RepID=A0A9P4J815_9PEZI|nr:kinesin-domain-containing protein [Myriangium duriaei CBS 260.36]
MRLSPFPPQNAGPLLSIPSSPPLLAPPSMPLPPIPSSRTRSRLPDPHTSGAATPKRDVSGSMLPTPALTAKRSTSSGLARLKTTATQSASGLPAPIITTTPADNEDNSPTTPTSPTSSSSPAKARRIRRSYRRTVSIGSFPQPPKGGFGCLDFSSSPETTPTVLSTVVSPAQSPLLQSPATTTSPVVGANADSVEEKEKEKAREPSKESPRISNGNKIRASASLIPAASAVAAASVGKSTPPVSTPGSITNSPALVTPSPLLDKLLPATPESRPSSAHGSATTDRTQFEDIDSCAVSALTIKPRAKMAAADTTSLRSLRSVKSSSNLKDGRGNVVVSVRVRPNLNANEVGTVDDWSIDSKRSSISYKGGEGGDFRYDNVFAPVDDNEKVYDSTAKRLVRRVMEGYHGTVFAYGITGTGKTFSMQGTAQSPGIIPLAITDIFSYIREHPDREFLLRVSYLEIYNERIYDLLNSAQGAAQEDIKLREDSKRGVYATPLKEEIVQSPTQLLRVIARGDMARRTGSTQFNARSSRSHAVVQIVVESRERVAQSGGRTLPGGVLVSTLSLIDLAGSERAAEDRERRTEGSHINKSLLTLGTVISRLSGDKNSKTDGGLEKDRKHLPYRDSKLTRLLQSALSGNALVSILCTVQLSPTGNLGTINPMAAPSETLNTLNFASRAKNNIVSHAKRNESHPAHGGDARALLDRYRSEIDDLKRQLEQQSQSKHEPVRTEEEEERWLERERESAERHEEQMLEMQLARTALKERIGHLNRLILSSKSVGVNISAKGIRDRRAPAPEEVGVALGSPEVNSRKSSTVSEDLDPIVALRPGAKRIVSMGSALRSPASMATLRQAVLAEEEEEDDIISADSGEASPSQQVTALQADLADKNRYIATLERRLLEARRLTQSRARKSTASQQSDSSEDMIAERDREIAELRCRLDDQTKMVQALRNATRRRGLVDLRSASTGHLPGMAHGLTIDTTGAERSSVRRTQSGGVGHNSQPSMSSSGSRNINFSRLTPVCVVSPTTPSALRRDGPPDSAKSIHSAKSLDDMTQALDQMLATQRSNNNSPETIVDGGMKFGASLTVHELAPPRPLMVGGMI